MGGADNGGMRGREANTHVTADKEPSWRGKLMELQRVRVLHAMQEACFEHGVRKLTVASVVEKAGVSRRTFYELFDDVDDCFVAALEEAQSRLLSRVRPAWEQRGRWHERVRRALVELLAFADREPDAARLLVVDALAAGSRALERRTGMLAHAVSLIELGRAEAKPPSDPPPLTGEGIVGGVVSILHTRMAHGRMARGRSEPLTGLTGSLMSMIVLPYLGPTAARREQERAGPEVASDGSASAHEDARLGDLKIRVTYRTIRVLGAVASAPGSSNRAVGKAAGIEDQGQISKLLARLERVGLVVNESEGYGGMANAWRLTERGEQIARSLGVGPGREPSPA